MMNFTDISARVVASAAVQEARRAAQAVVDAARALPRVAHRRLALAGRRLPGEGTEGQLILLAIDHTPHVRTERVPIE